MKTRIVYPQMWLDEKFAACSVTTKLLFCYLTNNLQLGLSRYLHITDRQILFDTGLTVNQLKTGKEELTNLGWVYFADNWVFHNHKAAYVDYDGRDRVLASKEAEIQAVPEKIKEVFNGLITGYKPVLNHKLEIINNNKGGVGGNEYHDWLKAYNQEFNTQYKTDALLANYSYWRKTYSQEELLSIIPKLRLHEWLKDKHKPELVLRQRDTHGNPVDRIGELLSLKDKRRFA